MQVQDSRIIALLIDRYLSMTVAWMIIVAHLVFGHQDYTDMQKFLAGSCGAIFFIVVTRYLRQPVPGLPILPWSLAFFYAFYCMPIFFKGESFRDITFEMMQESGAITFTYVLALILIISIIAGHSYDLRKNRKEVNPNKKSRPISVHVLAIFSAVSVASNVLLYYMYNNPPPYMFVLYVFLSPMTVILLWLYEIRLRPNNRFLKNGFAVYIIAVLSIALITGRMDHLILPLALIVLVMVATKKSIPVKTIFAGILILIILSPAKLVYRELSGIMTDEASFMSAPEVAQTWINSIGIAWFSDEAGEYEDLTEHKISSRFNYMSITAATVYLCPKEVPHINGKPWFSIITNFIPRFIWPGKPNFTAQTSGLFNTSLGFQTIEETKNSTGAFPLLADGYWSFGAPGVMITGIIFGLWIRLIKSYSQDNNRFLWISPYLLLLVSEPSKSFADVFSGAPQTLLSSFIVIQLIQFFTPRKS